MSPLCAVPSHTCPTASVPWLAPLRKISLSSTIDATMAWSSFERATNSRYVRRSRSTTCGGMLPYRSCSSSSARDSMTAHTGTDDRIRTPGPPPLPRRTLNTLLGPSTPSSVSSVSPTVTVPGWFEANARNSQSIGVTKSVEKSEGGKNGAQSPPSPSP